MIIWFTGQPNSGKTTLALSLETLLIKSNYTVTTIDGDMLRNISDNKDYSVDGRKRNISLAIELAKSSDKQHDYTIVALVSPFKELRDSLKNNTNHIVKEIYLHSIRIREGKMVSYYEPPLNNYLDIDTDTYSIEQSVTKILDYIQ